jgi:hypothetical protein
MMVFTLIVIAYLKMGDVNVISVDWSGLAKYPNYARAALSTVKPYLYVLYLLFKNSSKAK